MAKHTLLIFIKNPIPGKTKTRLAKTVGNEEALRIYGELLKHTRTISTQTDAALHLYYSHFIDIDDDWNHTIFNKKLQVGEDLGSRMKNAFANSFAEGVPKVVIIGSDCASLTTDILNQAFAALDTHDFVVGPTFDGGYYLIGMRSYMPQVFENMTWSTESVFSDTIATITSLQKSYALLPKLSDIDYEEDWQKYGWD